MYHFISHLSGSLIGTWEKCFHETQRKHFCCNLSPVLLALYLPFWTFYSSEGGYLLILLLWFFAKQPQVLLPFHFDFWSFSLLWILFTLSPLPLNAELAHSAPAQISPILSLVKRTTHLSLRLFSDLCILVCSLPFCVGLYINICYRSFLLLSTWHFSPFFFSFRFKIIFCLNIIWLVGKHDFFTIK